MKKQNNKTNLFRNSLILSVSLIIIITLSMTILGQDIIIDLVSYYEFQETAGVVVDSEGSNDGSIVGSVTRGHPGIVGNAFNFTGLTGTYANLTDLGGLTNQTNFSYSVWFNSTGVLVATSQQILHVGTTQDNFFIFVDDSGVAANVRTSTGQFQTTKINFSQNEWIHVVATYNSSTLNIYLNGTLMNTTFGGETTVAQELKIGNGNAPLWNRGFKGVIDEVGFWNRVLSQTQVSELYNNGNGLPYPLDVTLVTLELPEDNSFVVSSEIDFNASLIAESSNLTNATLNVWFNNGSIFNQTTNIVTGILNNTNWTIPGFIPQEYIWNVEACILNSSSDTTCLFAGSNFSFTNGFNISSQVFDSTAFETDSEFFQFNITKATEVLSVSAVLNYNGTANIASVSCIENECSLTSEIDINLIGGVVNETKEFFFETTLFTTDTSFTTNLTTGSQNVSRIFFDVCTPTLSDVAINFTVFDEQDGTRINPFYIAGEFTSWLGNGNIRRPLTFSNLSAEELSLCINPAHRIFNIDDTVEYNDEINSTTYNTRNYYFQKDQISSTTRNIPLFLLNVDDSTTFILKVQDTNLLPIADALIEIQRLDVGTGNFSIVQIAKTDDNGQTVGFFKTETVDYRFIIKKDGVTLLTTGAGKVVPETAPFTLTFTVGADEGAPWVRFEDLVDLTSTLTFNNTNSIASFEYEDISGNFTSSRLLVILQNLSGSSQTICDVNSTQSAAILTCDVNEVEGTYTASGFITRGTDIFLVNQIIFKVESFSSTAGLLGVFLAWFIILVSAFAFKFNEIAGIVLMNLTVIMVNLIGLVNFGFLFIFGMLGVSIMIIVLLNK